MKKTLSRLWAALLVLALVLGVLPVPYAAAAGNEQALSFTAAEGPLVSPKRQDAPDAEVPEAGAPAHDAADMVRVSIVLKDEPAIERFSTRGIGENPKALAYREKLEATQQAVTHRISQEILGRPLKVAWNLTLVANAISAEVPYGQIEKIAALPQVKSVELENRYAPMAVVPGDAPNMSTATDQTGAGAAWALGYTGAGTRIAILDTGLDDTHQSFDPEAFLYSLEQQGASDVNLLTQGEIGEKLSQLHIKNAEADKLYRNEKVPFAYNYGDKNLRTNHLSGFTSEHGSHVAGIAAANAYIPQEGGTYAPALETALVQGVAPDAQILVMKVFGEGGGAYDSDYMAAIEDAIVLGCDVVNLSLGSNYPGFAFSANYQSVMDRLADTETVVAISAGNSGAWAESSYNGAGYLYADDVSFQTAGSPGTFAAPLTVASVENMGTTGEYFTLDGQPIFYSQTDYSNEPLSTLAGDSPYSYVLVPGFGTQADFDSLNGAVEGKIAVVSRGEIAFSEKGDNAVAAGAIATIVYNNQPGAINADLSGYTATAPFICVSQEVGEKLKAADPKELTIHSGLGSGMVSQQPIFSDFSSWGVSGTLELKPEITAPGGNIYSVNGTHLGDYGDLLGGSDQYEAMSGTSMASPQVAGMSALLCQYIREKNLNEGTGLSIRAMAQSLLMSTAVPATEVFSGGANSAGQSQGYYPVLRQGAGCADVSAALNAESYIKMDAGATARWADGKVKAELGDDPSRSGEYEFSFTVNNLTQDAQGYTLRGEFFTQDTFEGFLDTWTRPLAANVTFTVDGEEFVPVSAVDADVNGDGVTNAADGQCILDYAAGLLDEEALDLTAADVDGSGSVTTYDAYEIFSGLEAAGFNLAPGASAQVQVHVQLTDLDSLNALYESGAYVEGFVFVDGVTTLEGKKGTSHSIPVLAFYGNWSDASMYDRAQYKHAIYNDCPAPYTGTLGTNALMIRYAGSRETYVQAGNPYLLEDAYPAGREAVQSDTILYRYIASMIRNGSVAYYAMDGDGELLHLSQVSNQTIAAYYHVNGEMWQNTMTGLTMNQKVSGLGVSEGDTLTVGLVAVPEYYGENGAISQDALASLISEGALGKGAYLSETFVVDDTAPEILAVNKNLENGDLTVTLSDNQYAAAVFVLDAAGNVLSAGLPDQDAPGETVNVLVPMEGVEPGPSCYIFAADYAGNETMIDVNYGGEPVDYTGRIYAFTDSDGWGSGSRWVELDPENLWYHAPYYWEETEGQGAGMTVAAKTDRPVSAAEYVKGYVFFASGDRLYVAPQGQWGQYREVGSFGDATGKLVDMAYNYADGQLYGLSDDNALYRLDMTTGSAEKVAVITVNVVGSSYVSDTDRHLRALAIDGEGNFYTVNHGFYSTYGQTVRLYRFTLEDVADGAVTGLDPVNMEEQGALGCYSYSSEAMAWDHDNHVLYFASSDSSSPSKYNRLWTVDPATGKASPVNSAFGDDSGITYAQLTGLYIVPTGKTGIDGEDQATNITLNKQEIRMLPGMLDSVSATVFPWSLSQRDVTWSSSDETVASVNDGSITAEGVGTAIITATTVAEPHLTAQCQVRVENLPNISFSGLLYDEDGDTLWADFETDHLEDWTAVGSGDSYVAGTLVGREIMVHDGGRMYGVDPDTFESTPYGTLASGWAMSDMAPMPQTADGWFGGMLGICNDGTNLAYLPDPHRTQALLYDRTDDFGADPLAVLAYAGETTYGSYGTPAQSFYGITEGGELYRFRIYTTDGKNYFFDVKLDYLGSTGLELTDVPYVDYGTFGSLLYDAETDYLLLASYQFGKTAQLYAIDPASARSALVGEFGLDVYPAVALYQYDRVSQLTVEMDRQQADLYVGEDLTLSARVLPTRYENRVIWQSSDPAVAAVDENGVVTGISAGSVTITATSAETDESGAAAEASCRITVRDFTKLDGTVNAQVGTGSAYAWTAIDLSDLSVQTLREKATHLTGGGFHAGSLYGIGEDDNGDGYAYYYQVDPETFAETPMSDELGVDYAPLDLTEGPAYQFTYEGPWSTDTYDAMGMSVYLAQRQFVYMMDGEGSFSGFDLAYYGLEDGNAAAIAYVGSEEVSDSSYTGALIHYYAILATDGQLYSASIWPECGFFGGFSYKFKIQPMGNVGMTFDDVEALTMTHYAGDSSEGLVVADGSGDDAKLYYIDLNDETLFCGKIGALSGITDISCLYGAEAKAHGVNARFAPSDSSGLVFLSVPMERQALLADGAAQAAAKTEPKAGFTFDVALTAKNEDGAAVSSTNGLLSVTYDPAVLEVEQVLVNGDYSAVKNQDGVCTIAYASLDGIPAGSPAATVKFRRIAFTPSGIAVSHRETGNTVTAFVEMVSADMPEMPFVDVFQGDYYYEPVLWGVYSGITSGKPGNRFDPLADCTRAETVTFLWRAAGCPEPQSMEQRFRDVSDPDEFYYKAVAWAFEEGITNGRPDGSFGPQDPVNRSEFVTFLWRAAGKPASAPQATFPDVPQESFYYEAVRWAVEQGVTNGKPGGRFDPLAKCLRGEAVTFLYRNAV